MSFAPLPLPNHAPRPELVQPCPECGRLVVWPRNDTLLDWPAQPYSEALGYVWTVTRVRNIPFVRGTRLIAMPGNPSTDMTAHRLHEHQPPESVVRKGAMLPWRRPGTDKTKSSRG